MGSWLMFDGSCSCEASFQARHERCRGVLLAQHAAKGVVACAALGAARRRTAVVPEGLEDHATVDRAGVASPGKAAGACARRRAARAGLDFLQMRLWSAQEERWLGDGARDLARQEGGGGGGREAWAPWAPIAPDNRQHTRWPAPGQRSGRGSSAAACRARRGVGARGAVPRQVGSEPRTKTEAMSQLAPWAVTPATVAKSRATVRAGAILALRPLCAVEGEAGRRGPAGLASCESCVRSVCGHANNAVGTTTRTMTRRTHDYSKMTK